MTREHHVKRKAKIAKVALALPPKSRAKLAEKLLASLDDSTQPEIDALWAKEAENRVEELERGQVKAIPAADVFRKLKARA
jgi:putative addiction module component (TIGR02574 family)